MRETAAKKSLGQHFLHDARAIRTIAETIPVGAGVLEIGPGPGAITEALLARAAHLTVIEKDNRYAAQWQARAERDGRLTVVHGDVMQVLPQAMDQARPDWIAGNLPYNISGPLTAMLASMPITGGMVLMYQREVGERLVSEAGGKTYGTLSVLVRHHYAPKRLLILPPGAFSPPPKVHSMVVVLTPHGQTPPCTFEELRAAVRQGFAHRRKTIANNFRGLLDADALTAIGIDPGIRPECLDYAAWTRLALAIKALPATT